MGAPMRRAPALYNSAPPRRTHANANAHTALEAVARIEAETAAAAQQSAVQQRAQTPQTQTQFARTVSGEAGAVQ